jgi:hypothetical protein
MSSPGTQKRRRRNPPSSSSNHPHPKTEQDASKSQMDWSIPLSHYTPSQPLPPQPPPQQHHPQGPYCSAASVCCEPPAEGVCCEPLSTAVESSGCAKTQGVCCDSAVPCMDEHCQKLIEEYCSQCLQHDPCPVEDCSFSHCDECCDTTCTDQCSTEVPSPVPFKALQRRGYV